MQLGEFLTELEQRIEGRQYLTLSRMEARVLMAAAGSTFMMQATRENFRTDKLQNKIKKARTNLGTAVYAELSDIRWTTRDKRVIVVTQMATPHIKNSLHMIHSGRLARESKSKVKDGLHLTKWAQIFDAIIAARAAQNLLSET